MTSKEKKLDRSINSIFITFGSINRSKKLSRLWAWEEKYISILAPFSIVNESFGFSEESPIFISKIQDLFSFWKPESYDVFWLK